MRLNKFHSILTTVAMSVFMAFGLSAAAGDWPSDPTPEYEALLAAAQAEGELVLLGTPTLGDVFIEAFEADTGIDVKFVAGGFQSRTRFFGEVESGSPETDAVLLFGPSLMALANKGLLTPVADSLVLPEITDSENWRQGGIPYVDETNSFIPNPTKYLAGMVLVNTDKVDPSSINNWSDLMAPEFAGKIATHDPKIIGGGQSVAIYLLDNMGEDFVKDFYLGQEVSIVGDYRLVTDTVARGTHFIGLSALSRDISKYRDQGLDNLAMLQMQDGPGFLIGGYGCIAIPKNSPNPNAAKLFANWYLSKRGQEMATTVYNIPSERVDVTDGPWPKFIEPAMGDEYLDMYTEAWHLTRRGELTARVNALLE